MCGLEKEEEGTVSAGLLLLRPIIPPVYIKHHCQEGNRLARIFRALLLFNYIKKCEYFVVPEFKLDPPFTIRHPYSARGNILATGIPSNVQYCIAQKVNKWDSIFVIYIREAPETNFR